MTSAEPGISPRHLRPPGSADHPSYNPTSWARLRIIAAAANSGFSADAGSGQGSRHGAPNVLDCLLPGNERDGSLPKPHRAAARHARHDDPGHAAIEGEAAP